MGTRRSPVTSKKSAFQFSLNKIQVFFLVSGAFFTCVLCFSLGLMLGYQLSGVSLKKQLPTSEEISSLVDEGRDSSFYETLPDLPKKPAVTKPRAREKSRVAKSKLTTETKKGYFVQVAAFRSRKSAQKLRDKLKKKGYPAIVAQNNSGKKDRWFRVRLGKYATRRQAEAALKQVKRQTKLKPFIMQQ